MATNEQALYEIMPRPIHNYGVDNIKHGVAILSGIVKIGTRGGRRGSANVYFGGIFSSAPIVVSTPMFNKDVLNALVAPGIHNLSNTMVNLSVHCFRPGNGTKPDTLNDPNLSIAWHATGRIYDYASFDA